MKNMLQIYENLKWTFEVLPNSISVRFMDLVHIQDAWENSIDLDESSWIPN